MCPVAKHYHRTWIVVEVDVHHVQSEHLVLFEFVVFEYFSLFLVFVDDTIKSIGLSVYQSRFDRYWSPRQDRIFKLLLLLLRILDYLRQRKQNLLGEELLEMAFIKIVDACDLLDTILFLVLFLIGQGMKLKKPDELVIPEFDMWIAESFVNHDAFWHGM